jgi:hypothetical protein
MRIMQAAFQSSRDVLPKCSSCDTIPLNTLLSCGKIAQRLKDGHVEVGTLRDAVDYVIRFGDAHPTNLFAPHHTCNFLSTITTTPYRGANTTWLYDEIFDYGYSFLDTDLSIFNDWRSKADNYRVFVAAGTGERCTTTTASFRRLVRDI